MSKSNTTNSLTTSSNNGLSQTIARLSSAITCTANPFVISSGSAINAVLQQAGVFANPFAHDKVTWFQIAKGDGPNTAFSYGDHTTDADGVVDYPELRGWCADNGIPFYKTDCRIPDELATYLSPGVHVDNYDLAFVVFAPEDEDLAVAFKLRFDTPR